MSHMRPVLGQVLILRFAPAEKTVQLVCTIGEYVRITITIVHTPAVSRSLKARLSCQMTFIGALSEQRTKASVIREESLH